MPGETVKYHDVLGQLRTAVVRFERSKTGAQVFRFLRLTVLGVATAYVTHNGVDTAAVVAIAEVAFRAVFDPPA